MKDDLTGFDPEIAAKVQGTKRKRKVTEALLQQAMTPIEANRVASGGLAVPISPWEGLAQIAKAYMASKGLESADKELASLASENQKKVAQAMAGYEKTRMGDPGVQMPTAVDDSGNPNAPNEVAPIKANPRQAVAEALANPMLQNNPLIQSDLMGMRESTKPLIAPAGSMVLDPTGKTQLNSVPFKPQQPKPPMSDYQITVVKDMIMKGIDAGQDTSGLQEELKAALDARRAMGGPQMPPQAPPMAPAGIPPEVLAMAQSGKPFVATQAPGQAPQFQPPPGLAPKDARTVAVDAAKSAINVNEARTKSNFDPTVQKEIIQTDEELAAGQSGLKSLQQALKLNDSAMGFPGAGAVATMGSLLPEGIRPDAVNATQILDNTLTTGALPQMRAIFGANPTEGERKILLDIQGSSSKPPAVRKVIIENAIKALNARMAVNATKGEKLRSGSYFSPQEKPAENVRVVDW